MIGFGLSEKPSPEEAHSLDGHIANLTALLRQLDLHGATLVCHDWGGPTGLGFALSNPGRVAALVVMSTWAWPRPPAEFHTRMRGADNLAAERIDAVTRDPSDPEGDVERLGGFEHAVGRKKRAENCMYVR